MPSTIVTKNSSTASAVPVTGDLTQGELAVNVTDKKLYTKDSGGTVVKLVGGLGNQEANAVAITGGSVNGTTIGATTASTGAFTTLSASSTVSGTGFSTYLASPPAIGGTTAAAGSFTTLSASGNTTLSGGTANGVAYLNGSKVVTTGSALTFDGTNLGLGTASPVSYANFSYMTVNGTNGAGFRLQNTAGTTISEIYENSNGLGIFSISNLPIIFGVNNTEQMRLTSTGLGIGTSSPAQKLHVVGNTRLSNSGADALVQVYGPAGYGEYLAFGESGVANRGTFGFAASSGTLQYRYGATSMSDGTLGFAMDSSGNLGIGTSSPTVNLHVYNASSAEIRIASANIGLQLYSSEGAGTSVIGTYTNHALVFRTNATERARITSGGEVYIAGTTDQGAYNLQVNGTGVWGAGAYVNGSDARLKEEVQDLAPALDVIASLRPVTFRYKEDYSKDQNVQPGFIAQELQTAMAGQAYVDGVIQSGPQHLNVAYQSLIPLLTKAIQELKAEFDAYKATHP